MRSCVLLLCVCLVPLAALDMSVNETRTFTATVLDQFGDPMAAQPTVNWSVDEGSLSAATGASVDYTAPASAGSATLTASAGAGVTATRDINIVLGAVFRTISVVLHSGYDWTITPADASPANAGGSAVFDDLDKASDYVLQAQASSPKSDG